VNRVSIQDCAGSEANPNERLSRTHISDVSEKTLRAVAIEFALPEDGLVVAAANGEGMAMDSVFM
jgi:hypothetical protein